MAKKLFLVSFYSFLFFHPLKKISHVYFCFLLAASIIIPSITSHVITIALYFFLDHGSFLTLTRPNLLFPNTRIRYLFRVEPHNKEFFRPGKISLPTPGSNLMTFSGPIKLNLTCLLKKFTDKPFFFF